MQLPEALKLCLLREKETQARGAEQLPAKATPRDPSTPSPRHPTPAHLSLDAHAAVRFLNHADVVAAVACGSRSPKREAGELGRAEKLDYLQSSYLVGLCLSP